MSEDIDRIKRRHEREKKARKEAEVLLEEKSLELFNTNQKLQSLAENLEQQVKERTAELEVARDEALASVKAKSYFLANMSHEIRTPMNGVLSVIKLLRNTQLSSRQDKLLNTAEQSGNLLLQVINDILDITKLEANKLKLESIAFNPRELLELCMDSFAQDCYDKGVDFFCDIGQKVPFSIEGDPTRIQQILSNFISNSFKFTDSGQIVVGMRYCESNLYLSVKDSGIGMTKQQIDKVFKPFTQADESTTRKYGGSGLGLSICKHLVKIMNGDIHVDSIPNLGSTFSISIPCRIVKQTENYTSLQELLHQQNILIVIDDSVTRDIIVKQLKKWSIPCYKIIESVEKAKKIVDSMDLIILDMELNGSYAFSKQCQLQKHKVIQLGMINGVEKPNNSSILVSKPIKQSELYDALVHIIESSIKPVKKLQNEQELLKNIHILLTEDNQINQLVATEILEEMGAVVDIANNGKEALDKVQSKSYSAILMDIQMPVMGGLEASQKIRQFGGVYQEVPIIAMTAHAFAEDKEKSIAAGMNAHLTKPIEVDRLAEVLKSLINNNNICSDRKEQSKKKRVKEGDDGDKPPESILGIDLDGVLYRFKNRWKIIKKVLIAYSREQADFPDKINEAIKNKDTELAIRLSHTVKGSSANIGATKVSNVASSMESCLKRGMINEALAILPSLKEATAEVISGIHTLNSEKTPVIDSIEADKETIICTVNELGDFINCDLGQAKITIEKLNQYIASFSELAQLRKNINESFEQFNFDKLKQHLEDLTEQLPE